MGLDWGYWLQHYGYAAILVGTFLEGESILVLGALAAQAGYLSLGGVLLAAFCGSFSGDQLYFFLGRRYGRRLLMRNPTWQVRVGRVHALLYRYRTAFVLGFRFLYGLRSVSPFVLGTGDLNAGRFFVLNALGALLWAVTIGVLGFGCARFATAQWANETFRVTVIGVAVVVVAAIAAKILYGRRQAISEQK